MRVLLGTLKEDNTTCYLTKHKWDCDWYWGLGYIDNNNYHTRFDSTFLKVKPKLASEVFSTTNISDSDWWIVRDLFIQAYALKKVAEVYVYGGHQTYEAGTTDIIKDVDMCTRLNRDLEKVLDTLWDFVVEATKEKAQ